MKRRVCVILAVAILVMASLMAFPGCGEKKTGGDNGDVSTNGTGKPEVLMFTQEGCPPCVPVHEIVEELEKEMSGKVAFRVIHAENDSDTFRKYNVQATPTIIILDSSGNVVQTLVGGTDKETLESELEKLL
ncbi:MAG: thioredoxin family protein [Actinobacteria bacterium]|nr:thioredoxin family protein [Actinomycetota bacterium]MCG2817739.1 thioredoxin family protein [Actinomycetes bacterium]MBU4217558.1 thioredoxin family protein [Actinomycetota bacterium]MBU4359095.1 thioredoxin family protein [Actinomycetota bacterium]MBU4391798.1 thioredoxin family protein [Actinomycetota bacterium]